VSSQRSFQRGERDAGWTAELAAVTTELAVVTTELAVVTTELAITTSVRTPYFLSFKYA
jgi:hypothetical protein